MAAWKQFAIAVLILLAAALAWARFVPGAPEVLARWGIDWAHGATPPANGSPVGERPTGDRQAGGRASGRQGGGDADTAVLTAPVGRETINDELSAIGTGRALSSVTVVPYATGRLTNIAVASGARVTAGETIAEIDAEAEQIALDRARISLEDAQARLKRAKALRASNTASAVQVTEAELGVGNAELAVREAELNLERRRILAPISGVIGILPVEVGNYVTTQTPVATIDDRSRIVIDFWAPERYAGAIEVGASVSAVPIAGGGEALGGLVSAIDNRLDEQSRTLRVQATIDNPEDRLRAGMSFQIAMRFPGDAYAAVPPLAVQWGADGSFVWTIRDGKAVRVPARIIQRNTENVLVEAELTPVDVVVTEGIHVMREGAPVQVAGATTGRAAAAPVASSR